MGKWEMVRLGDVGKIVTGNTPSKKNAEYYNSNDISFFKPNDISDVGVTTLIFAKEYISNNAVEKVRVIPANSALVTCIGTIGKVGISQVECACNQQINAIIPNINVINSKYLCYVMLSCKRYLQAIANAPVVPIINKSTFSEISIPLPPIEIQEQIARNLDRASELVKLHKTKLEELDKLIQSVFYDMFGDPVTNEMGWEVEKLNNTARVITGNTPPRNEIDNYGDYIEWIKSDNITDRLYVTTAKEYLSKKGLYKGRYVDKDTILMTCIAGSLKSIGRVAITNRSVAFNQQINAIIPIEYNMLFLYTLFYQTQSYIQSTINMSLKGILSKGKLECLEFIVPPIPLQQKFANIVTEIENQKTQVQQALDDAEMLYNSLMQEYFE